MSIDKSCAGHGKHHAKDADASHSCCAGACEAASSSDAANRRAGEGPDRRLSRVDRRTGLERRETPRAESGYTGPERRVATTERRSGADTGLERRRGPGRRLADDRRSAEEGEMTAEQFEFVMAVETYKKINRRLYPTWTEILEIVLQLGYRKIYGREIQLDNVPEPELEPIGAD